MTAVQIPATYAEAADELVRYPQRKHKRAGITTNKGRGTSKARRQMAKASRRRNRGRKS